MKVEDNWGKLEAVEMRRMSEDKNTLLCIWEKVSHRHAETCRATAVYRYVTRSRELRNTRLTFAPTLRANLACFSWITNSLVPENNVRRDLEETLKY